jgi:hypothetical protein
MKQRISKAGQMLWLAALIAVATSASARAAAPTAERALLGRTDAPLAAPKTSPLRVLDGARALLGREAGGTAVVPLQPAPLAGRAPSIDGARALLGRVGITH